MSRYTGPSWKVSRRLGISLSGTGKELARRPYASFPNMVCNCVKSKSFA